MRAGECSYGMSRVTAFDNVSLFSPVTSLTIWHTMTVIEEFGYADQ